MRTFDRSIRRGDYAWRAIAYRLMLGLGSCIYVNPPENFLYRDTELTVSP